MRCYGISKIFNKGKENECTAVNTISLAFAEKGLVFITGKSGSGKSTFLNILGGLDEASEGTLYDGGLNLTIQNKKEKNCYIRNNVGFIFQNYHLINELSVEDNILIGLKKTKKQMEQYKHVLSQFDISQYTHKPVSELSGGEQQRVSIARAFIKNSKLIIGDEPTGNLDSANAAIIFEALKEISKERLVIIVTHDQEHAEEYGDRIITFSNGSVIHDTMPDTQEAPLLFDINQKTECHVTPSASFHLSWQLMKQKKARMLFSTLLAAAAFGIFGIFLLFQNYSFKNTAVDFITESQTKSITAGKGYTDQKSEKFVTMERILSEGNINELVQENNITEYDLSYKLLGMYLSPSSTGSRFIPQFISSAITSSKEQLEKYSLSIQNGSYPLFADQIAVTDYLAYCIYLLQPELIAGRLGLPNLDQIADDAILTNGLLNLGEDTLEALLGPDWSSEGVLQPGLAQIRKNPGLLLINSKVDFLGNVYEISAVLKSDFFEKYQDMIYMDEAASYDDSRSDEFLYNISMHYASFFVTESFAENIYQDKIIFSNAVFCKYSAYQEQLGITTPLTDNHVILSSNFFRELFQEEFSADKKGSYTFPNQITIPLGPGMQPDIIFDGEDLNVIGTVQIPAGAEPILRNSMAVLVSDAYFEQFAKAQTYSNYITFRLPLDLDSLFQYMEENELFFCSPYSFSLYNISNTMMIYQTLFIVLTTVLLLVSALLLFGFFSSIISNQKREIGIMRAIGLNQWFIIKINLACQVVISACLIAAASLILLFFEKAADHLIAKSFSRYFMNIQLKGLSVLELNGIPFACIIALSIFISIVSILYPIQKFCRMNPTDIIRR